MATMHRLIRSLAALLTALAVIVPAAGFAQDQPPAPAVAPPATAPSYAKPSYGQNEEIVRGQVVAFDGAYSLQVRDDRGFVDNVQLRQGTIINPTGLRLVPGMSVTVRGVNAGSVLAANQIDTPYQSYGYAAPVYGYPAYGYPAYGYPAYGYPYGAAIAGLAVGIGIGAWCCSGGWYGGYRGGYYGGYRGGYYGGYRGGGRGWR